MPGHAPMPYEEPRYTRSLSGAPALQLRGRYPILSIFHSFLPGLNFAK